MKFVSPIGARLRFSILARDHFRCRYCGQPAPAVVLHVDHVIPRSRGGSNDPLNLVAACSDCNFGKSNLTIAGAADWIWAQAPIEEASIYWQQLNMPDAEFFG